MEGIQTLKGSWPWPWPWIRPYGIPSCITHRPLPIYQISLKSKELFVDGRTYGHFPPPLILLGRLLEVDLTSSNYRLSTWSTRLDLLIAHDIQYTNHLTGIFQEKPVTECHQSTSYWNKDDGGGDDNWSYKTCKAAVKSPPPTHQYPTFTGGCPFASHCHSIISLKGERITFHRLAHPKLTWGLIPCCDH